MKKLIFNFILILIFLIIGINSCKKDPVSEERILTAEEKEILRIQDSLRNLIDADTFLIYQVALPLDSKEYRFVEVQHDSTMLAKALRFKTPAELRTALGTVVDKFQTENTVKWLAMNNSTRTDYTDEYTGENIGFWYNRSGDIVAWDDSEEGTSVVFTNHIIDTWITNLGQFPARLVLGEEFNLINVLENAKGRRVALIFKVIIGEEPPYVDPETKPSGSPIDIDTTINISHTYVDDYSSTAANVRNTLRNAFKMTTYQIYEAIKNDELILKGINADESVYTDSVGNVLYTAAAPGHWFSAEGNVTTWGDTINLAAVYSELRRDKDFLELDFGNHPDNVTAGTDITFKQKAELNGGSVTFTVNLKVE